jgi:hypothetical protein
LPALQSLSLEATPLGDGGLAGVERLEGLQNLSLTDTKVTDVGVAKLQLALPQLKIKK